LLDFDVFFWQGMVFLTLSAAIPSLRPPPCPSYPKTLCRPAYGYQIGMLYVGLYLIALGNGGIKPNVSTLGADQFDESDPNERKHMSNFFNWFYFIISIGSLLSVTVFVYIQVNKILLGSVSFVSSFTKTEIICPKSAVCRLKKNQ
jgi:peptide/histidine transporter 3/4